MMNNVEMMRQLRAALMDFAKSAPDAQAYKYPSLFDAWASGTAYNVDDRCEYADKLWKCLQAHTSQDDWTPSAVPALWVEVAAPGEYREIKDNMLSTEAFAKGEIGWYGTKDNLYKSLIDANVYTPDTYPAGWEKVTA